MYTTADVAHAVRHPMAHGLFAGVQIVIPREDAGVVAQKNWVHLVETSVGQM